MKNVKHPNRRIRFIQKNTTPMISSLGSDPDNRFCSFPNPTEN
jgi:hypothetical protein